MSNSTVKNNDNDDISLYGLFSLFFKNWLILAISGFSFAALAAIWAIQQPNIYEAQATLMPAGKEQGGIGGLSGKLGGLAAMAGVSLPQGGDSNTKLALELVESRAFIMNFIKNNELLVPLMAVKAWDLNSNTLEIDENIYDEKSNKWVRGVKAPKQPKPSLLEAYEVFLGLLTVDEEPKTKFVKISIEHHSPYVAADWVTKLVSALNDHIRKLDMDESDKSINYLTNLVRESNVSEIQNAFSELMQEQLKARMLSEVRADYVYKVVDPAIVPENKSKPKRAIIVVVGGFLGGILGIIIVLFRAGRRNNL